MTTKYTPERYPLPGMKVRVMLADEAPMAPWMAVNFHDMQWMPSVTRDTSAAFRALADDIDAMLTAHEDMLIDCATNDSAADEAMDRVAGHDAGC